MEEEIKMEEGKSYEFTFSSGDITKFLILEERYNDYKVQYLEGVDKPITPTAKNTFCLPKCGIDRHNTFKEIL